MTNVIKKVADKAINQTCASATPSEVKDFLYRIHTMLFEWKYQTDRDYIDKANDNKIAFLSVAHKTYMNRKGYMERDKLKRFSVEEIECVAEDDLFPLDKNYRSLLDDLKKTYLNFLDGFKEMLSFLVREGFLDFKIERLVKYYKLNYEAIGKILVSKQDLADVIECDRKSFEELGDWLSNIKAAEYRYETAGDNEFFEIS